MGERIAGFERNGVFPPERIAVRLASRLSHHVIGGGFITMGIQPMHSPVALLRAAIIEMENLFDHQVTLGVASAQTFGGETAFRFAAAIFRNAPGAYPTREIFVRLERASRVREVGRLKAAATGRQGSDNKHGKQNYFHFFCDNCLVVVEWFLNAIWLTSGEFAK